MESLKEIRELGRELGYEGEDLKNFVKEQQDRQREERREKREILQKEQEIQREKQEYELKMAQMRFEQDKAAYEAESKVREHQQKLEMLEKQQLFKENESFLSDNKSNANFPKVPKIPPFEESQDEMDSYLNRFERYATVLNWKREIWAANLSALLKGRALDVYARLPVDKALNYDELKSALLKRFELTEEGFKNKFRSCKPEGGETYTQFTARLERVGALDYKLKVGSKEKSFHANMLKPYLERSTKENSGAVIGLAVIDVECEEDASHSFDKDILVETPASTQGKTLEPKISDDLQPDQVSELKKLLQQFPDVLSDKPGFTNLGKHDIKLTTSEPIRVKPYPLPFALQETVKEEVGNMLDLGVIEPSTSEYCSNIVLVKKPDGSIRFCIDFRPLNRHTVFDCEPIPNMEEIFVKMSKCKYISKLDLTKGYWQLPLTDSAKPLTAFQTPLGLFQFRTMPFGLVCASASFSRIMRRLLSNMTNIDNFIDDIFLYTQTFLHHLQVLTELFLRLRNAHLTVKPSKCCFGFKSIVCLGHIIGNDMLQVVSEKVEAVKEAGRPTTKKQVRSFMGMVGFYMKFIPHFATIAAPLTDLTRKQSPSKIVWGEAQERSFQLLKNAICSFPILKLPDLSEPFILQTDCSNVGIGSVLLQVEDEIKKPIAYASRKLKKAEMNYSTTEKECLAIVWSILRFQRYLYGTEFTLESDHQPLVYLNRKKMANARLMRWSLLLQPYRFRVVAIRGRDNVIADYLSRL